MITYIEKPKTEKEIRNILHPIVEKWFFSRFKSFSLPQLYGALIKPSFDCFFILNHLKLGFIF